MQHVYERITHDLSLTILITFSPLMLVLSAPLTALPRRAAALLLRPYSPCPRVYRSRARLTSSSSSSSSSSPYSLSLSPLSYSPSSPSSSLHPQRLSAAGGVRSRGFRTPLIIRSDPPRREDFIFIPKRPLASTPNTMAATKIDGTAIAKSIREGLKAEIEQIQQTNPRFKPSLTIFQSEFYTVIWIRRETAKY